MKKLLYLLRFVCVLSVITPFTDCFGQQFQEDNTKEPPLVSPHFFYIDSFMREDNRVNPHYAIPTLVTTNKGTLIAVCDARGGRGGDPPNHIALVMKRSFDGGRTWTPQETIVSFTGKVSASDASMVVDKQTGTIWLAYDYTVADPQGNLGRIIRIHLIKSDDDGVTWSMPINLNNLTTEKPFWLQNAPGRGLYTPNGEIVFPMYTVSGGGTQPDQEQTVLIVSKDHGKSWYLSNVVGDQNPEPQIASLPNGGIIANMRRPEGEGYRQIATTYNLGQSWLEAYTDSTLIEPGCQGSIINYRANGKSMLLFSIPDNKKYRRNLVLHVSDNDGKTWAKKISIYKGRADYSCLTELPNGDIGILFEAGGRKRLVFAIIPSRYILNQIK